ncbi:MAG: transcriptional repressor LexA [Wenzhouxiangellaceae bacterium]|nr:transcriptional repressor LexA [Wenzhouxiangellaceae bacterium]
MDLSRRQSEILEFIRRRIRDDGLPPTRAEINAHFGFASPNAAQSHLKALERKGAIRITPGTARGLHPVAGSPAGAERRGVPLVGRVAAGRPILAVEHCERTVEIDPALFRPRPDFLLRVEGESMRDAGILEGDLLAVHRSVEARNGDIVVARVDDEVTVKRFRRDGDRVVLEAANPAFSDLVVTDRDAFAVEGRAVGVLRGL